MLLRTRRLTASSASARARRLHRRAMRVGGAMQGSGETSNDERSRHEFLRGAGVARRAPQLWPSQARRRWGAGTVVCADGQAGAHVPAYDTRKEWIYGEAPREEEPATSAGVCSAAARRFAGVRAVRTQPRRRHDQGPAGRRHARRDRHGHEPGDQPGRSRRHRRVRLLHLPEPAAGAVHDQRRTRRGSRRRRARASSSTRRARSRWTSRSRPAPCPRRSR